MALITRFTRMMRADLHAVLDRIEEPEILLRQALREMDEAVALGARRLAAMAAEQARLARRDEALGTALESLEEELDLCFEADKHDLARNLVRRKLETARARELIAARRRDLDQARVEEQARLEDERARLDALRQQAELCLDDGEEPAEQGAAVAESDVEVAFLKELKRRSS